MSLVELSRLVSATTNRLRLIQVDFADDAPEVRQGHLSEEIGRALSGIVPQERRRFLDELMRRFPAWETPAAAAPAPPAPPPVPSDVDTLVRRLVELVPGLSEARREAVTEQLRQAGLAPEAPELSDADFLVGRLAELFPDLPEARREAVKAQLRQSGLAPQASGGAWSDEAERDIRAKLPIPPNQAIDPDRALALATTLSAFASEVDQVTWKMWHAMMNDHLAHQATLLMGAFGRFVCGEEKAGGAQIGQYLDKLRKLNGSIIWAVAQAGEQFAGTFTNTFAPQRIEQLVSDEGGSWTKAFEVKCWNKYKTLAADLSDAKIQGDITAAVVQFVRAALGGAQ